MKTEDSPRNEGTRRPEGLRVLHRISAAIASSLDPEEIYRVSLETLDELFGFHHSILLLLDEDASSLTVVASRGYGGDELLGGRVRVGVGVIGMVAKKRRAMHVGNLGAYRAYVSAQRRRMVEAGREGELGAAVAVPGLPDAESQIAVPLLAKDELIGVFSVESREARTFDEEDEELVTVVATQMASAIQVARLYRALQRTNDELERRVAERTAEIERELRVAQELLRDASRRVAGPLLGDSAEVRALREAVERWAATDDTVLLAGPPGSGKEAAARAIHAVSARHDGAFLHVHCPLFGTGDRSSLFGSTVRLDGKKTGPGGAMFELAERGTLYLEAVEELPRELQRDLNAVLSRIEAARAAGETASPDVRVLLATGTDLGAEVRDGHFDLELYRRIAKHELRVPALCERPDDIPGIAEHFLREETRRLGKNVETISADSIERLRAYRWPGNVRELRHVLERAVILAEGTELVIEEDTLGEAVSLGSYRLVERLGSGGMGEVWLAKHALLARPAAVKLIRTGELGEPAHRELRARFRREAEVTASLRSPHTVQLYDFGIGENGTFYYVMEYLKGMDLAEMVDRFGPLPPERVVFLLRQACSSLIEAHERGLVHRDVKPANLYVGTLGAEPDFLKVVDFGVVKALPASESPKLTQSGRAQGTPAFMAPELALGEVEVDGRADLYSLGCAAFWMLTGMLVFDADNPTRMIVHHLQSPAPAPSSLAETDIPEALDRVVLRCLAKSPDDRPPSARELRRELRSVKTLRRWSEERAREWWATHLPAEPAPAGSPSRESAEAQD